MAGIYIHIPFCKQACHYCNFHFSTSLKLKNDFVAALLKETGFQSEYLQDDPVETIYFGGGTPSLLNADELNSILEKMHNTFNVATDAEITLEANPDDIDTAQLETWRNAGINRLSIGVQSFFEEDLIWMNRAHHAQQALNAIRAAQQAGFDNLTIDLIYGSPGLTDKKWQENVEQAIALNIPHLSCYALTVEPKTPLQKMISLKKTIDVNPDDQARQFVLLMDWLDTAGYEHYEISNFAKPSKRSQHNSSYWRGKKYLGLGPSAHSYNGYSRQWNVANNARYIQSLQQDQLSFEKEMLTITGQVNEYIMISLRTMEGCDLQLVSNRFGVAARDAIMHNSLVYITRKLIRFDGEKLVLTQTGKLHADGIASALFFEKEVVVSDQGDHDGRNAF